MVSIANKLKLIGTYTFPFFRSDAMVRNPKPKPEGKQRQRFSDEKLNDTIRKIQGKFMSIREAARTSGIPKTTLLRYLKAVDNTG